MKIKGNKVLVKPDSLEATASGIVYKKESGFRDGEIIALSEQGDYPKEIKIGARVCYPRNAGTIMEDGNVILPTLNIEFVYH